MLRALPPDECSRARESVSARLDGELSELEAAGLDDHLRACAECSAFARELHALGSALRTASLEQPRIQVFATARRRPLVRLQTAAAAAAIVAVAAGTSFAAGRLLGVHGTPPSAGGVPAEFLSVRADSTRQHVLALLPRLVEERQLRVGRDIAL
ncbi:MAG TPA: zf-HC2 domain-containing protein [Gaiellaceae bacterium]|jgi:anti-sigma factor RsiW|nr:zf-HC2 domain-containing protein [Gaiellaceae bacterium]